MALYGAWTRVLMELTASMFGLVAIACFLAVFIQRVSGFGYGIIVMMFYPLALEFGEATALSGMGALVTACAIAYTMRRSLNVKKVLLPLIPYSLIGYLAIVFVKNAGSNLLMLMLGFALCAMSIYFAFFSGKIQIRPTAKNALISGSIGGVLSGLFSMGGPAMVVYFLSCSDSKDEYLANIQFVFVLSNIITAIGRMLNGFVTQRVLWLMIPACMAMVLANFVGAKVYNRISTEKLRKVIYGVVGLCGLLTIFRATVLA